MEVESPYLELHRFFGGSCRLAVRLRTPHPVPVRLLVTPLTGPCKNDCLVGTRGICESHWLPFRPGRREESRVKSLVRPVTKTKSLTTQTQTAGTIRVSRGLTLTGVSRGTGVVDRIIDRTPPVILQPTELLVLSSPTTRLRFRTRDQGSSHLKSLI